MKKSAWIITVLIAALMLNYIGGYLYERVKATTLVTPHLFSPGDPRRPSDLNDNSHAIENVVNGYIDSVNVKDNSLMNADINSAAGIVTTKFNCTVGTPWALDSACDGTVDNADSMHTHAALVGAIRYITSVNDAYSGATATVPAYSGENGLIITFSNMLASYASATITKNCQTYQSVNINGTDFANQPSVYEGNAMFASIAWPATAATEATAEYIQKSIIFDDVWGGFSSSTVYTIKPGACHVQGDVDCELSTWNSGDNACASGYMTRIFVEGY